MNETESSAWEFSRSKVIVNTKRTDTQASAIVCKHIHVAHYRLAKNSATISAEFFDLLLLLLLPGRGFCYSNFFIFVQWKTYLNPIGQECQREKRKKHGSNERELENNTAFELSVQWMCVRSCFFRRFAVSLSLFLISLLDESSNRNMYSHTWIWMKKKRAFKIGTE